MDYRDKVRQLEAELKRVNMTADGETCMSKSILIAIAAPILIFIALYVVSPSFVNSKYDGKEERSIFKVIMYTVLLSMLVWGGIYGYNLYMGI
jgi:hypothetical protein